MQVYNQFFETSISIPIKYVSVPDSIIFQDSLPSQISLRIKDNGFSMFKYYFKKRDTLRLDVSAIINSSSSKVLQGSTFDMYVRKALPSSTQILSYDPLRISFNYSILEYKKIPVVFDGQINLSPGYFLNSDIRIVPDSVTAYAARPDLDKLMFAYTVSDTVSGLNSDKVIPYKLVSLKNIKFVPDVVDIDVPVEAYTQKNVEIPVECINLPDNLNIKFFPSKVKLSFFVGVSEVDSINMKDFSVAIDYDGIKDSKQASVPVRITSSPSYVRNLTISPPNVEFIFEYKNTKVQ
ncbi:YbbR-like domain-containing protein [Dysgonomonas sp. GY617]|uniref:YbbR-like domain-containing protein n=1 Tax=Dysgonomonas sp. GY617 TaxID=2780420 RepID=UPI0018840E9C|nr:YbbR-like domain-containing protein [Dysgonomonas sp. GY617]MBF0575431.1 YbbR-like domain-containing protein [Dysgonomonas sp. GY617]